MKHEIRFTSDAERHLKALRAGDRATVLDEIEAKLQYQPATESRHVKELRSNPLARWELRVGEFRVFYNVEDELIVVFVIAVGHKTHNRLTIDGKEYLL